MATSLNSAQIIGNLGKDCELRYLSTGTAQAQFTVATSRSWKNKGSDEWKEETEWHNVVLWGDVADRLSPYLLKGKKVYVEGRIQTRTWSDDSGVKHYRTEIQANNVITLDRREQQGEGSAPSRGNNPPPFGSDDDSDLPFD